MKTKRKLTAWIFCLLIAALVLGYSQAFAGLLLIAVYVMLFLLVLSPLCRRLEQAGLSPAIASGISVAIVFAGLLLILIFFLPYLIVHTARMASRCMPVLMRAENMISSLGYTLSGMTDLLSGFVSYAAKLAGMLVRESLSAAAETGRLMFSLVIAYYTLKERVILGCHMQLIIPSAYREKVVLALKAGRNAVMGYFSGLIKTSLFVGLATTIVLFMTGVKDAILLGILMGMLEIVPYAGPVIGAIPILLSTASMGLNKTLFVGALLFLIQQAESSFVGPYFTASSTAVHPLAALLSVYIFGSLFGIWGILFAVPCVVLMQNAVWSIGQLRNVMNT